MDRDEILKHFTSAEVDGSEYHNALRVAEHVEFERLITRGKDYRDAAIKVVCDKKLPFTSTCNCIWELVRKMISVKCPYCGGKTEHGDGSGNGSSYTTNFTCTKCGVTASISLPPDGLHFAPKKER